MAKQKYILIGHPVKHSLSPAMQNAAFESLGIDAKYLLYDIEPGGVEAFLGGAAAKNISGLNVTIPHKFDAFAYLEKNGSVDENAKRLGAVNTIAATERGLRGYNTDGAGFYRSLVEDLRCEPEGKAVFILGAGGAAAGIAMYLGNGPKKILISDTDAKRAEALAVRYKKSYDGKRIALAGAEELNARIAESDIFVNATPVGMKESDPSPVDKSWLRPGLYVYDLVYNWPQTALIRDAVSRKCHAATGLGMLLYQGAIAFEIWTGRQAPVAVMRRALKEALKRGT